MKKWIIINLIIVLSLSSCQNRSKTISVQEASLSNWFESTEPIETIDFTRDYTLIDSKYGTKTKVKIKKSQRIMTTNGLPNHMTGSFPNKENPNAISTQDLKYIFPLNPIYTGRSRWARELGIAVNGVKFEPETAERFVCETGEQYKIEAFQDLIDLGLDESHAHVQPTGAYHYHGVPSGLVDFLEKEEDDLVHVGFAHDGFFIYYSKSGIYKSSYRLAEESRTGDACSYRTPHLSVDKVLEDTSPDGTFVSDWEYEEGYGDLDECNGIRVHGEYAYMLTDEYPFVGRCLMGEFKEKQPSEPPPGAHPHPGPPR